MTVHLLKMAVGIESVKHLAARQRLRVIEPAEGADAPPYVTHVTRHTPKRAAQLLDGGSLYWVIGRQVRARQAIVGIERLPGAGGPDRCELRLDPAVVRTVPRPHRAFQGWRYLPAPDAPADLNAAAGELAEMPPEMLAELRLLGLL
jgi:hypothetical protein